MLTRLPPLNALRAFEAAARHTSFARAADELAVTPAAISQQVRQLEEDLGVQLFRRLPRGLMLTDAGRSCLPELGKAFHHLARAVEDVRAGSIDGRLVVSVIPSFAHRWLLPRLPTFCAAFPRIDLTISAEMRNVDFANEDVDIGIRYGRGVYPGLETSLLLTELVFPVCAPALLNGPKGIRRPEDLRHHTLLHDRQLSGQEPSLYWRQWLRDHGLADIDADRGPGFTDSTMLTEAERGVLQTPDNIPSVAGDPDPARYRSLIDAERTLRLEAAGYEVNVVAFVSKAVSGHNLLWRCRYIGEPNHMRASAARLSRLRAVDEDVA